MDSQLNNIFLVLFPQELQEEDMLSPAVFQLKPDVADVEMISGRATEVLDLMDEASTAKVMLRQRG